jgi:hypothetical protein
MILKNKTPFHNFASTQNLFWFLSDTSIKSLLKCCQIFETANYYFFLLKWQDEILSLKASDKVRHVRRGHWLSCSLFFFPTPKKRKKEKKFVQHKNNYEYAPTHFQSQSTLVQKNEKNRSRFVPECCSALSPF